MNHKFTYELLNFSKSLSLVIIMTAVETTVAVVVSIYVTKIVMEHIEKSKPIFVGYREPYTR